MADLISRSAAIEYLMTNMGWHDEDGYEVDDADEKCAIITDLVNGIPAVAAVPVEWLRKKIKEHTDEEGWQDYLANSFGLCIEEWQKEQEMKT